MGLFGGSDVSGFNLEAVENLHVTINDAAKSAGECVVGSLTKYVVTPMADAWYAEEAQQYFKTFSTDVVAKSGESIQKIFQQFQDNVVKTGNDWAKATGASVVVKMADVDPVIINLSVDAIKATKNGDRALDEGAVQNVISSLSKCEDEIKTTLASQAKQLDASTAFLGHGQSDAVQDCFVKVSESIHKIFEYILLGNDALSGALTKYKEKYITSAKNVATSFNNANVTIEKGSSTGGDAA